MIILPDTANLIEGLKKKKEKREKEEAGMHKPPSN
jgi:hypothetical protein